MKDNIEDTYFEPSEDMCEELGLVDLIDTVQGNELWESVEYNLPDDIKNPTSGLVDGENIIGRAVGRFFVVDGTTQNNRFYPRKAWSKALDRVQPILKNRKMLGAIGHRTPIDENTIANGLISHIVNRLWIGDDGYGYGEILILNTEAGRNLLTLLKSGYPFPVSSRAKGKVKEVNEAGQQVVDPDHFYLKTFDFVVVPGLNEALPSLVEELKDTNVVERNNLELGAIIDNMSETQETINNRDEVIDMDNKVLEELTKEKLALQQQLSEALDQVAENKNKVRELEEQLEEAKTKVLASQEGINENLTSINSKLEETKEEMAILEEYNKVLTSEKEELTAKVSELEEALKANTELEEKLKEYEENLEGVPAGAIRELIKTSMDRISELEEALQAKEADVSLLERYKAIADSPEQLEEAISSLEKYLESGTVEEVETMCALLEEYAPLGTPSTINEKLVKLEESLQNKDVDQQLLEPVLEAFDTILEEYEDKLADKILTEAAQKVGVAKEAFQVIVESMDGDMEKAEMAASKLADAGMLPKEEMEDKEEEEMEGCDSEEREEEEEEEEPAIIQKYRKEDEDEEDGMEESKKVTSRLGHLFENLEKDKFEVEEAEELEESFDKLGASRASRLFNKI